MDLFIPKEGNVEIKELENQLGDLNTKFVDAETKITELQTKNQVLEQEKAQWIASSQHSNHGGSAMSLEKSIVKSFGVNGVKDLIKVNTAHPRFAAVPSEMKAQVIQLKQDVDTARHIAQMYYNDRPDGDLDSDTGVSKAKEILNTKFAKEVDLEARVKAFDTGVAGSGAEFIPTLLSDTYMEEIQLIKKVPSLFRELALPSSPFKMPMTTNYTVGRIVAENNAATDTSFTTTDVQFDAKKFYEYFLMSEEMTEDSAPAILQIGRQEIGEAIVRAWERSIIDGDDSVAHMDSDVVSASDARKAFKGLRKKALANSANGSVVNVGTALTFQKLLEMRAAGGPAFIDPRQCALLVGVNGYNQLMGLSEVITVDKAGGFSTLVSGSLASIMGMPIVTSQFIREDLNAAGVHDGLVTDNTFALMVNTRRFMLGMRRPIRLKVQRDARAEYDRWQLVAYSRTAFNGAPQGANENSVVIGVNVSV
jgi:HK97 family phage major capsid protein